MPRIILLLSLFTGLFHATPVVAQVGDGTTGFEPRKVFITSVSGTGDLSTWPDANSATGVTAGDFICQNRASAAGLSNPGDYMAWLSDSNDDAYCRLHWQLGKRDDNCGQTELPEDAGPWVRTDGQPFAAEVGLALFPSPNVFLPPKLDEFGNEVPNEILTRRVATGTDGQGQLGNAERTCQNWTSNDAEFIGVGNVYSTGTGWSVAGVSTCSGSLQLFCIERGSGPPLPPFQAQGKLAFVTSVTGDGELASWPEADPGTAGVEAGDSICRNLAGAAGMDNADAFKAWLSDSSQSAHQRLASDGPWIRPDGVPVADTRSDLATIPLNTAIAVTEQQDYLDGSLVWTGTTDDGDTHPDNCDDWANATSSFDGRLGAARLTATGWSSSNTFSCDIPIGRLYCLEDEMDAVFFDNFEL